MESARPVALVGLSSDLEWAVRARFEVVGCAVDAFPASIISSTEDQGISTVIDGPFDVLVAGDELFPVATDDSDKAVALGVRRAFLCIKAVLRGMVRRRFGRIVLLAPSLNTQENTQASTRLALLGLTKSVAREVGSRGITANMVAPGFLEGSDAPISPYVAAGRRGTFQDVAEVIAFAANDVSAYLNGQILPVDGGLS